MTATPDTISRAATLARRHSSGDTIVLPTVWDCWSAGLAIDAGFTGLTVGSHPVANALGNSDGEDMDLTDYLAVIRRICASVSVPVSADVESGYGLRPTDLVNRLLEVGAVGANVEDTVHSEGDRIRDRAEHADYVADMRAAADAAGVEFVINGRTDALVHGTAAFADPLAEAQARCVAMEQAGARSVYPVRLPDAASVTRLAAAVSVPVNVTASPVDGQIGTGLGLAEVTEAGARRVTFGPMWQNDAGSPITEMTRAWLV